MFTFVKDSFPLVELSLVRKDVEVTALHVSEGGHFLQTRRDVADFISAALSQTVCSSVLWTRLLKSKKSKKLGFLSDVWACFMFSCHFFQLFIWFLNKNTLKFYCQILAPNGPTRAPLWFTFHKRRNEQIILVCYFTNGMELIKLFFFRKTCMCVFVNTT